MTAVGNNHINALEMENTNTPAKTNKMPKTSKKTESAPAPVAAATTKTPAAKKESKKASASKAEAVVPTVTAPTVVPTVVAAPAQSSEAQLASLTEKLKSLASEFTVKVREAVKATQEAAKQAKKEQRDSKKKRRKNPEDMTPEERKAWEAKRANNAFIVPRLLSDELCAFMGIPSGSKRGRTEVTKFIVNYIKTHKCFDPTHKRKIIPNAALEKLLRVDDEDKKTLSYLTLQKYLKVHYKKTA